MDEHRKRRRFLTEAATLLGAAYWPTAAHAGKAAGEVEIRKIVRNTYPISCVAPVFVAAAFLRAEGFDEVEFRLDTSPVSVGPGRIDMDLLSVQQILTHLDDGVPISVLSAMHLGCYE